VSQAFTVPGGLAAGTYRVLVATDSGNRVIEGSAEGDNVVAAPGTIAVTAQPRANLVVSHVTAPLSGFAGQPLAVSWTVRNTGVAAATGRWFDAVYLSLDQIFDSSDRFLGYLERTGPLDPDHEEGGSATFRVPQGVAGAFNVFVVADAGGAVTESNESDNGAVGDTPVTIELPPPADLVIGTLTVPASAVSGALVSVTYTVENRGTNAAGGFWTDSLFLSSDDAWDVGDIPLGRVDVFQSLEPGASYSRTLTAPTPTLTPGDYRVIVRSDIRNTVPESDESNNIGASIDAASIEVPLVALDGDAVGGTLAEGASAGFRFVVPSGGETVRLTFDSVAADGDTSLFVRRGSMPTASSYDVASANPFQADQALTLSADVAGTYYVLVQRRLGGGGFTLRAETVPFSILGTAPSVVGSGGEATLRVEGARFTAGTTFRLVTGD
ncbi:MAG: hypothetical protein EBU70_13195, partial [Actinobacteria bacterium]|nr:hypothetical protein [Actinomycetota bacterium]